MYISRKCVKMIKYRIKSFSLSMGAYITYDKKTDMFVEAHPLLLYTMIWGIPGGGFFVFVHALRIYLKANPSDIEEEPGSPENPNQEKLDMYEFATTVIGVGEILVVISLMGVNYVLLKRRHQFMYAFNVLFRYNEKITVWLEKRGIESDKSHKVEKVKCDGIVWASCTFSWFIGFAVLVTCLHPIEPTHAIMKEWLELEFKFHPKLIPVLYLFMQMIQGCANTVITYALLAMPYIYLAAPILKDVAIEGVAKRREKRCVLETAYWGNLEDKELADIYRTQRLLNVLMNDCVASVWVSLHQVGMLACLAIMLFFFVKFQPVIDEVGPIGYVVVIGCLLTPIIICFFQSQFFGVLEDASIDFAESGRKLVARNTFFRRVVKSTQPFYFEEAYPFFHYHKQTFLEFSEAGLDHAINLLMW